MMNSIAKGTEDLDNQAAGLEFKEFEKWAAKNEKRMSPEAKKVMDVYDKYASAALAKGQTGISQADYAKMLKEMKNASEPPHRHPSGSTFEPPKPRLPRDFGSQHDASAHAACDELRSKPGTLTASDLTDGIYKGTRDLDNGAAGSEFAEFERFAKQNKGKLSPEAQQVMDIYKKYADAAKAKGQTGIDQPSYDKMIGEMRNVGDKGAETAMARLDKKNAPISQKDLADAIYNSTKDPDNNAAGKEFKVVSDWVEKNRGKLSPEALQAFDIYKKTAQAAQSRGQTGIDQGTYDKMIGQMRAPMDASATGAMARLDRTRGTITAEQFTDAVHHGTRDLDNSAAGSEFDAVANWVAANGDRLSPEAKQAFEVYKKTAEAAKSNGQTGIDQPTYDKMIGQMHNIGDRGAEAAMARLDKKPAPISQKDMADAIYNGTKDPDNNAAAKEFKVVSDWVEKNRGKLSPEALQSFDIYKKYAEAAQAHGQTGLDPRAYDKMVGEMRAPMDASATGAMAQLDRTPGTITAEQFTDAVHQGTRDLDNSAAGSEFDAVANWVAANGDRLSPEAKQAFEIYKKTAEAAKANGRTGIDQGSYDATIGKMRNVGDRSAETAVAALDQKPRPISQKDMADAINNATKDLDNNAAGKEFKVVSDWVEKNRGKLSPEALQAFDIYKKCADSAKANGQTGIDQASYDKMIGEIRAPMDAGATAAMAKLDRIPGRVSADQMTTAIAQGTRDLDNSAAGKEFDAISNWAAANPDKLSAGAKKVLDIYKKYADEARGNGQTGIDLGSYNKMIAEMHLETNRYRFIG
jgi:uncharacterized protein YozE (UPF0346 family)